MKLSRLQEEEAGTSAPTAPHPKTVLEASPQPHTPTTTVSSFLEGAPTTEAPDEEEEEEDGGKAKAKDGAYCRRMSFKTAKKLLSAWSQEMWTTGEVECQKIAPPQGRLKVPHDVSMCLPGRGITRLYSRAPECTTLDSRHRESRAKSGHEQHRGHSMCERTCLCVSVPTSW